VATHPDVRALSAVHHDRGVPAAVRAEATLEGLVAGELRFGGGRDRVDVVGGERAGHVHLSLARPLQNAEQQRFGPHGSRVLDQPVQRLQPLLSLGGILVGQLTGHRDGGL
jgi:hypothetical protein